jgi:argininosuccinate synthase
MKVMKLHKGDVVVISGKVEAASRYAAEATTAESGSMNDAQKSSGVFLRVHDITVSSSTHK